MNSLMDTPPNMTGPQWNFIKSLCEERDRDPMEFFEYDKRRASETIDYLKGLPKVRSAYPVAKDGVHVEYEDVDTGKRDDGGEPKLMRIGYIVGLEGDRIPRGRYALQNSDDENDLTFYRVWVGDRGGWSVKVLAGPNEYPIQDRARAIEIMNAISEDPPACSAAYGWAIGRCGICGYRLTNQVSRELGMGPVCRSRVHW